MSASILDYTSQTAFIKERNIQFKYPLQSERIKSTKILRSVLCPG